MLWQNVTSKEQIKRFAVLAQSGRFYLTDLCEQCGTAAKPAANISSVARRWAKERALR